MGAAADARDERARARGRGVSMGTTGTAETDGGAMGWVGDLVNIIDLTPDTRTAEVVGNFVVTDGSPQRIETPITGLSAVLLPDAILLEGGPGGAEIPDDTYVGFKFTDLVASPIASARFDPEWGACSSAPTTA